MYIPSKEGGRRMTNFEMAYKTTTIGVNNYLQSSGDFQLNTAQKEIDVYTKPKKQLKIYKSQKCYIRRHEKKIERETTT